MKVLIDADGCPVVNLTLKICNKFNIKPIIMCDTSHIIEKEGVEVIVISKGIDAVDFALLNKVNKNEIVITQDYGLAAMVISKGGYPINQKGKRYTTENIDKLLFTRYINNKARSSGQRLKGPKKRCKKDDISFENNLVRLINDIHKN